MKKFAVIVTSAILAFSAVGCQAWGTSSNCSKCCCKCNKKCNKCNKKGNCNCCKKAR